MADSNKVFVSPGIYTKETDLTFVSQSVGVTTLGLAGETKQGPAFEPVLIKNFDEFRTFFGTTSPEKDIDNNPKYELSYVAKSYLQESNQLFVTRVLGLTGYRTKMSYGIKTLPGIEFNPNETPNENTGITLTPTEADASSSTIYSELVDKTALSGLNIIEDIIENAPYADGDWFSIGLLPDGATSSLTGSEQLSPIGEYSNQNWRNVFYEDGVGLHSYLFIYSSIDSYFDVVKYTYTGATENEYGNIIVAELRSRGSYVGGELTLQASGSTSVQILDSEIENNPLSEFTLNVDGSTSGVKNFTCSLDRTSSKYITKVLGTKVFDNNQMQYPVYVNEAYPELVDNLFRKGLIRGLSSTIQYEDIDLDFISTWKTPETPMVVSEVRGGNVFDLFKIKTISDGDSANKQIKVTISNIDFDLLQFDVLIRDFNDTDENMVVLEKFGRCSMNPELNGYIAKRIGTENGEYELRSKFIYLIMNDEHPTDAIPAGFKGYVTKNISTNNIGSVNYKTRYYIAGDATGFYDLATGEPETANRPDKYKKETLGLSTSIGYDNDMFMFKGENSDGLTPGFHMSVNASSLTGDTNSGYEYETTPYDFEGVDKGMLENINFRKFTFTPAGGFDGWDIYRQRKTNRDEYVFGKKTYIASTIENGGVFDSDNGNSDFYAYQNAINTFANPEAVDINVFATPGIDFFNHGALVTDTIDMIENERADSVYIMNAPNVQSADEIVDLLDIANIDSNYSATYWPWIQIRDNANSSQLYIPPTAEVVKNIALTDNIAYPWYAVAGYSRGIVSSIKAFKKLTLDERDTLYKNRINPIATFSDTGTIIFGNKTLQVRESALDRLNVRRLLLRARKLISSVAVRLLFDQNDEEVRNEFQRLVTPILDSIQKERGLYDFRLTISDDPEDLDSNTLSGKIYIQPTKSLEYVDLEYIITPTGASFEDV